MNILAIFYFRILINFNIFNDFGPLGGVPPPKPTCFPGCRRPPQTPRPGGKAPRTPLARKRAWYERRGNMKS